MKIHTFQYSAHEALTPRVMQAWVREALEYALDAWRRDILPKHFTKAGGKDYGYQARTKQYMIYKAKTKGTQAPLVWSGDTKRMASTGRITSHGLKATLSIPVPDYVYTRRAPNPKTGKPSPNLRQELTAVTSADIQFLERKMDEYLNAKAAAL